jgi:CTP:molybdopterin cytidylyltransferase MocA
VKIAGVVLAAGASTRLGRPKQTLVIDGETLVERAARVARESGLSPVFTVVAPAGDFGHSLQQQGCIIVLNESAAEGIAASIRNGIKAARVLKAEGVVLLTCDQPALTADHLRALCAEPQSPCGSGYAGKVGIPAYFPASSFDNLLQLKGDTGARDLLRNARSVRSENLSYDIDTETDITKLSSKLKCDPLQG